MSRVYEALKRAGQLPASPPPPVPLRVTPVRDVVARVAQPGSSDAQAYHPGQTGTPETNRVAVAGGAERLDSAASTAARNVLLVGRGASAFAAERYRALAGALQDMQQRSEWSGPGAAARGLKSLLVTSALPGEGKTLTAVNLALTLAETFGRHVLLIDAHPQSAGVPRLLQSSHASGPLGVVRGEGPELPERALSPGLAVLTLASSGATAAVDRLAAVLAESASRFDWILIDAPAVSRLDNAHAWARIVRAVLFVIRCGATPYPRVESALATLGRASVVGTVLNRADELSSSAERRDLRR